MVIKTAILVLLFALGAGTADASELTLEPRLGWFEPTAARDSYREVYGRGGPVYGLDLEWRFPQLGLSIEGGVDHFEKSGSLVGFRQGQLFSGLGSTTLRLVPFHGALIYGRDVGKVRLYGGLGPALVWWSQTGSESRVDLGAVYLAGIRFWERRGWTLGAEYRYLQVPDALRPGGLGDFFGEDDIGGHRLFFTAGYTWTFDGR